MWGWVFPKSTIAFKRENRTVDGGAGNEIVIQMAFHQFMAVVREPDCVSGVAREGILRIYLRDNDRAYI